MAQQKFSKKSILLHSGIELRFLQTKKSYLLPVTNTEIPILEIIYCHTGCLLLHTKSSLPVSLERGDCALYLKTATDSSLSISNNHGDAIVLEITLESLSQQLPTLLKETGITHEALRQYFYRNGTILRLVKNRQLEDIFLSFYNQPETFQLSYWLLKTIELLLHLHKLVYTPDWKSAEDSTEQIRIVHRVHQHLIENIAQRITIEELATQYFINTTTLKTLFKSVYGTSIAAHIKAHRMETAAKSLLETDDSIAQISYTVGYKNQSKFTAAFKEYFCILPTEYRKQCYLYNTPIHANISCFKSFRQCT